jgi:hypothetical protein
MFAALTIVAAVALLLGVRHEPAVKAWAMRPRTPGRIAATLIAGTAAAAAAVSIVGVLVLPLGLIPGGLA